jgi:hypothetical protein
MARIGSARRAFEADTIQADKLFELAVDAASDYLTAILGGIAAEGLVVNGAAYVVARSGEDIPTFFALLHTLSPGLAPKQADALWGRTFRKCHEQAWTIVRSHQAKVLALAEALKPGALLTNQDIEDVIAGV